MSTARHAALTSAFLPRSTNCSASISVRSRSVPIGKPASRSDRASTIRLFVKCDTSDARDQFGKHAATDRLDVFFGFQQHTERFVSGRRVERLAIERGERGGPVERFRDTGHLVELARAELLDNLRHLRRQRCGGLRDTLLDDGELFLEGWVVDPLVEAAAFE